MHPFYITLAILMPMAFASAQVLRVDSVSVDSIWNSDSTWPTGQRLSRDCKVSFRLQGSGYARIFVNLSVDNGKTWGFSQDSIFITPLYFTPSNSILLKVSPKDSITVRFLGGDRPAVALRILARQAAPALDAVAKKELLLTLSPGQITTTEFQCNAQSNTNGFCDSLEKVYWDASADGTIDDSTPNANFKTPNNWAWQTTVPSDGQSRKVIARARDKNGLWGSPDTVTVKFGLLIDDLCRSIAWLYSNSGIFNYWMIGDIVSDDAEKGGENIDDYRDLQLLRNFNPNVGNAILAGNWHVPYETIVMANRAIDSIPCISIDVSLKARQIAEAKFLRAWSYFILVKSFGDVPLTLHAYSAHDYCKTRTPKAQIWAQIEEDLAQAAAVLPKKSEYSGTDVGRVSKGAAQALLVKAYIYQNKFAIAKTLADTIILSNEYGLEPNYADNFLLSHENGIESVLEVQYFTDSEGSFGNDFGGQIISIYQAPRTIRNCPGWGFDCPTQSLAAEFEPSDPRKKATIIAIGDTLFKGTRSEQVLTNSISPTGMHARKYLIENCDSVPSMANYPANWRAIRYSEVLLFAAEASNEIGNVIDAAKYLNMVRERVHLPAVTVTDKESLRNAIYHERRVELALEGHRFWDVVRRGRGQSVFGSMGFQAGKNEIFPIPQSALDSCKSLTQNPGY